MVGGERFGLVRFDAGGAYLSFKANPLCAEAVKTGCLAAPDLRAEAVPDKASKLAPSASSAAATKYGRLSIGYSLPTGSNGVKRVCEIPAQASLPAKKSFNRSGSAEKSSASFTRATLVV